MLKILFKIVKIQPLQARDYMNCLIVIISKFRLHNVPPTILLKEMLKCLMLCIIKCPAVECYKL